MDGVIVKLVRTLHGPMLVLPNDMYIGRSLDHLGEFSVHEQEIFGWASRGGAAIDIGANVGAHSICLASLFRHVYCFEPQEFIYRLLVANLAATSNTTSYYAAVGNTEGILKVPELDYSVENNFGGFGQENYFSAGISASKTIRLLKLDDVLPVRQDPQIDFIKIDVEGMEKQVLEGAQETVAHHKPIVYVENDKRHNSAELVELIYRLGYKAYWHISPLYRRNNFNNNPKNLFPGLCSFNLICMPNECEGLTVNAVPCTPDRPYMPEEFST